MAKALKTARRARQGGRVAKAGSARAKGTSSVAAGRKKGELSFVAVRPKGEVGRVPRDFWRMKPTGNFDADVELGRRLGLEYLEMNPETTHDTFLQWIVADMPRALTGVEIGFLEMVHVAARAGRWHARALAEWWALKGREAA